MTEWFLISWLTVGVLTGAGIVSVWWRLKTRDLIDHYEARLKAWQQRYNTALAAVAEQSALAEVNAEAAKWQAELTRRLDMELEMERIVSGAFAAGIQREERS